MTLDSILHARVDPHSLGGGLIVAVAGLGAMTAQDAVSTFGAVALGVAFVCIQVDHRVRQNRRDQKRLDDEAGRDQQRLDVEAALVIQRRTDAANHESLTARIGALQATLDAANAELTANQDRMRESLHRMNGELHASRLETAEVRAALAEAHRSYLDMSASLAAARVRIAELLGVVAPIEDGRTR